MLEDRVPEGLEFVVSEEEEPEPAESADELILTPTPEEEQEESDELVLEADDIPEIEEITFEGETEAELRVEKAMEAYDATMDEAAGLKK